MASAGRLLILDDDPLIAQTVAAIAEMAGVETRSDVDPSSFFDRLAEWKPTHLFIDLHMPQMDGMEVLAELSRRRCTASIIISSGVGSRVVEAAAVAASELGLTVVGMLPKPFRSQALRELLTAAPVAPLVSAPSNLQPDGPPATPPGPPPFTPGVADLVAALKNNELFMVYQPKVRCLNGSLAGMEALVRWRHPVHGLIGPNEFIPLAEANGLVNPITVQVLEQSLFWFSEWSRKGEGRESTKLSVNLSARDVDDMELANSLLLQCNASGIKPERLVFELTETATMNHPAEALAMLTRFRVHGFSLSLDDFGTCYSSLVQLVRLPFSELKIDQSFVKTASTSRESRTVIRCMVDLGRSLGMITTAEGVEDAETLEFLRDVGCDLAQGYQISRPLEAAEFEAWYQHKCLHAKWPVSTPLASPL